MIRRLGIGLAAGVLSLAMTAPNALSQRVFEYNTNQLKYYWEDPRPNAPLNAWGWDYQSRPLLVSGPVRRKKGESVYSFCARQVGRIMRVDDSSLIRSTGATDACVRRGGSY